jgi:predicted NBD/HSP70 family sugar kinase
MKNSFFKQAEEGNKNAILKRETIRRYFASGDVSIIDLSEEMGLSVPTVTKLVRELIDEGFVLDFGKQGTNGGRKPNIYGVNPAAGYFIGVDIKNDFVEIGAMDFKGAMIELRTGIPFTMENTMASLEELSQVINQFIDTIPIAREKMLAVGINLSGRVNSRSGYSYSYYFLEEAPLTMMLESKIGCSVFIENDSRAMAYGEYKAGVGNNEETMLFINASWGLGAGFIIDGKLFYGKSGFSGEFGHFPFFDNEIICRCGKRGCLETGASGSAVHRIFMERLKGGAVSMLSEKFAAGDKISLDDIMTALGKEDVLAIEVMEQVGHALGKAISGLINLFNPELIVIGGTLAEAKDYLMLPLKSSINKHSLILVSKDTTVKLSRPNSKIGVKGACMLTRDKTLGLI